mgnify:CR=1 FL=1
MSAPNREVTPPTRIRQGRAERHSTTHKGQKATEPPNMTSEPLRPQRPTHHTARKRYAQILAALAAVGLFIAAHAAGLGGMQSAELGADVDIVQSCDTDGLDVRVHPVFDGQQMVTTQVSVDGIAAACVGQDLTISLSDGAGIATSGAATITGTPVTVTLDAPIAVESIENVAAVITG